MANIVVTKVNESIVVEYNDYSTIAESKKRSYYLEDIVEVELAEGESHVVVMMRDGHGAVRGYLTYDSAYSGTEYFIVDSVEGLTLSSNEDLFDKITALR